MITPFDKAQPVPRDTRVQGMEWPPVIDVRKLMLGLPLGLLLLAMLWGIWVVLP